MNHEDNSNETIVFLPPIREKWSVIKKGIYDVIDIGDCLKIDFQGIGIWIGAVPGKEGCPYDDSDYHYKHVHLSIGIDDFSISAHEHYNDDFILYNGANVKGEKKEKYAEITTLRGPIFLIPKTVEWNKYWGDSGFSHENYLYEKECDEFYMVIGAKGEDVERLIEEYGGIGNSKTTQILACSIK